MKISNDTFNLTEGSILQKIIVIAVPIMGTQFLQMAYNLTDMFWLGRVGSHAIAASGAAGMYMWLSMGFLLIGRMGAEIGVAQSLGKGDQTAALNFSRNSLCINLFLGILYGLVLIVAAQPLASFFPVGDKTVVNNAAAYLRIIGFGIVPAFMTGVISGTFYASGNSRTPFLLNGAGLFCNVILDPLCIMVFGMGIRGAAYATVFSQSLVALLMIRNCKRIKCSVFYSNCLFNKEIA